MAEPPMLHYSVPQQLYKYLGYNGLHKTLQQRSLKLSCPADFNAPLDMFLQQALGMEAIDFLNGFKTSFYDFISGDIDYALLSDTPARDKIILMNIGLQNATSVARESMRKELIETPIEDIWELERLRTATKEALDCLKHAFEHDGIFCSTVDCNNLLMWAHYTDQHKGAVIEFTPSIARESALLERFPVRWNIAGVGEVVGAFCR
jgi:hypothetical protein